MIERFQRSAESFSSVKPKTILKVAVISIFIWMLQTLLLFTLFKSVNLNSVSLIQSIIALIVLGAAIIIPLYGIASIGTYEAGIALSLISFGISHSQAITYAIAIHALSLMLMTIIGILPLYLLIAKKPN